MGTKHAGHLVFFKTVTGCRSYGHREKITSLVFTTAKGSVFTLQFRNRFQINPVEATFPHNFDPVPCEWGIVTYIVLTTSCCHVLSL